MKMVRYEDRDGAKLGAVKGEGVVDLGRRFPSLSDNAIELIRQWRDLKGEAQRVVAQSAPAVALATVRLLAPVARPGKVMGIGLKYADHITRNPGKRYRAIRSGSPRL